MDLHTVREVRSARDRSDLQRFRAGEAFVGGGTWLFSQPQPDVDALVDLTDLDWPPLAVTDTALSIAGTCTLARLARLPAPPEWLAKPLFGQCCAALVASSKVLQKATFGGNIALSLPAGSMTSLAAALDGIALLWPVQGGERRVPVAKLVTGPMTNGLQPGEVVRAVEIPLAALEARTAYRKIALSPLGRSASLVIGRLDPSGACVITVTAATERPQQLRFAELPPASELAAALSRITCWHDDVHGPPDWREAMSALLAEEIRVELGHPVGLTAAPTTAPVPV